MDSLDYEQREEKAKERFFSSKKISEKNKEIIMKFLRTYDVKPATKVMFFEGISKILELTDDIEKDMHDRDKIEEMFYNLKNSKYTVIKGSKKDGTQEKITKNLSKSTYGGLISKAIMLVTWLNDDEKPQGFKRIKNLPKKAQKRDLDPKDMTTLEDLEKLKEATNSIQYKAILSTQLDGGFRATELFSLRYGDLKINGQFILSEVRKSKTGKRTSTLWRCVPDLMRWLNAHPTKKDDDPLWIREYRGPGGKIVPYNRNAVAQRIRRIFKRAGINKPCDFYALRHSACTLSKKDNLPEEIGAGKFGHSIQFYTQTYGRLSQKDVMHRFAKHYGLKEQEPIKLPERKTCRCGFINDIENEICEKCGNPISLGKALEIKNETERQLNELTERLEKVENQKIVVKTAKENDISLSNKEDIIKMIMNELFEKKIIDPNRLIKK